MHSPASVSAERTNGSSKLVPKSSSAFSGRSCITSRRPSSLPAMRALPGTPVLEPASSWRTVQSSTGRGTRKVRNMISDKRVETVFHEGDGVVLARGTYQGTLGIFGRLKEDFNWAEIIERNGTVRSHPVAWLELSTSATPGIADLRAI